MTKITTFFMFQDGSAEAMDYYVSIFKNSRIVSTMPGPDGKPIGGTFELEGSSSTHSMAGRTSPFRRGSRNS